MIYIKHLRVKFVETKKNTSYKLYIQNVHASIKNL